MSKIFADNAPLYWSAGLPVIPLYPKEKRPAVNSWSELSFKMPSAATQDVWMKTYSQGNIGLVLGPCSGLVAVDVDTEDHRVHDVLDKLLPRSPWTRVGKKGSVKVFKTTPDTRPWKIKDSQGNMLVELLAKGNQVVLPPSIHPETQMPYKADSNLYEVLPKVLPLPEDFETALRRELKLAGIDLSVSGRSNMVDWVPAGARDDAMMKQAGYYAAAILKGDVTLVDALDLITTWCENFTEKVSGDLLDPSKARMKVVECLRKDIVNKKKALPKGWDTGIELKDLEAMGMTFDRDVEQWDFKKLKDYLMGEFTKYQGSENEARALAVNIALEKIANNPVITDLERERLFKWIATASRLGVGVPALRKQVRKLETGEIEGINHSEIALSVIEDLNEYGEHRFSNNKLWKWNGAIWDEVDENDVIRKISDNYGHLQACKKFNDLQGIKKLIHTQLNAELCEVEISGINFANGFLTDELELKEHAPQYGKTYYLPFEYDATEAGNCRNFMSFLNTCWGKDEDFAEKVLALQEALCVTLFGLGPRYQRAFCLKGLARTGKSTLLEIVEAIVPPDGISHVNPVMWKDRFAPADMFGKILNVAGELSEDTFIHGARFKEIITGERIRGEFKNQNSFDFKPICAHWFATNVYPKSRDTSDGFNRRWLYLTFNRKIPSSEIVLDIAEQIICEERQSIVAWAVEALPRLQENNRFTLPASHLGALEEMATDNNPVRFYLCNTGRVEINHKHKAVLSLHDLYQDFWETSVSMGETTRTDLRRFTISVRNLAHEFGFVVFTNRDNKFGASQTMVTGLKLSGAKK